MQALPRERALFFELVAARIVPELASLEPERMARFIGIVDGALMDRPPELRRQFGALLGLIRWLPLLRWGTSFERLSGPQQDRVLRWVQDAPVARLRAGFWGLKTLVFMGYYGQPEVWPELPYLPRLDGNEALHA